MSLLDDGRDKAWDAPKGTVYVCSACGRHGKKADAIGDEACFLSAVLCYEGGPPWKACPLQPIQEPADPQGTGGSR